MKPGTLVLAASLAANVALLTAFAVKPSLAPPSIRDYFVRHAPSAAPNKPATAPANGNDAPSAAKQAPADRSPSGKCAELWQSLESSDLPTLIARLRAAGFPPGVIRSVVMTQLEARQRSRLEPIIAAAAETPYWKADGPNTFSQSKIFTEMNAAARERTRALRDLLGDDFFAETGGAAYLAQRYGNIPRHKVDMVQRIADDYNEMIGQVRTAAAGMMLPEDTEKIELLERERNADLAAMLTPDELEEYEMRTSRITSMLRRSMTLMDASEEEFRAIYRVYAPLADSLYPAPALASFNRDERGEAQRKAIEDLKAILPPERFADFTRANNNEFQQLARIVENEKLTADTAVRTFALRDHAATESQRIGQDAAMTTEQKRVALKALAEQTRAQAISALGSKGGEAYLRGVNWLNYLDRGMVVTINPDGNMTPRPPTAVRASGGN